MSDQNAVSTIMESESEGRKSAAKDSARGKGGKASSSIKATGASYNVQYPVDVNVRTMLEAGAHFGHQTQRWNPRMLPYIYCAKNGVHILNLDITLNLWKRARDLLYMTALRGGTVLFAGTKQQAREIIKEEAERCDSFYVNTRWLGGTLTNFQTIKNSIERMRKLEEFLAQASVEGSNLRLNKKEKLEISREVEKLETSLGGIRNMKKTPDVLFVVDIIKEAIAVQEARKLRVPVIALVDSNTDPTFVDYPIPANDDATRTIRLFCAAAADAIKEANSLCRANAGRDRADTPGSGEGASAGSEEAESQDSEEARKIAGLDGSAAEAGF